MKEFWPSFWLQAWRSLEAVVVMPSLLLMLLGAVSSLVLSVVQQRPLTSPNWRSYYWLAGTQSFFFPAIVSVSLSGRLNRAAILLCFAAAAGTFWIYRMKGLRWFACSLIALQDVLLLGAFFIAVMSVTGVRP
jgi:hypothetical protein